MYEILEEIIEDHPVLLNRAPTLHRLGIQAFEPVLVEGKAIRIHPLVCAAFNADFDGDQMAVHVPLSFESQLEARLLMISSNNILKPSDGRPVAEPSQDMVLGCHFLTKEPANFEESVKKAPRIGSMAELEMAIATRRLEHHSPVQMWHETTKRWIGTTAGRVIFNSIVPTGLLHDLGFQNKTMRKKDLSEVVLEGHRCARLTPTVRPRRSPPRGPICRARSCRLSTARSARIQSIAMTVPTRWVPRCRRWSRRASTSVKRPRSVSGEDGDPSRLASWRSQRASARRRSGGHLRRRPLPSCRSRV